MYNYIQFQKGILADERLYGRSRLCYFIAEIQCLYGLRISEVLSIKLSDIGDDYKVTVQRLKREDPVVVSLSFQERFIHKSKEIGGFLFDMTTRFSVYYTYKECGIGFQSKYSSKLSVTHSYRHLYVRKLLEQGYSYQEVAVLLGHEDERNTELYGVKS
jgi:integrase